MASDERQKKLRRPTRAKKKVITSCLECYRRKQKCDRVQPCNFCSIRGVPELCRYGANLRASAEDELPVLSPPSSKDSYADVEFTSHVELLDQIGYSSASRRSALEAVGAHHSEPIQSNTNTGNTSIIADADTYQGLVTRLPSDRLMNVLIDAHFSIENWSFPVLEESHFRNLYKQFQDCLGSSFPFDIITHSPSTLAAFPALLFSVLAVALQFITPDTGQTDTLGLSTTPQCLRLSQQYLALGQDVIRFFERQRPTTTSVEFYLMKTVWLKNGGRGSEAWQCLGVALRQAQQIDLHQVQEYATEDPGPDVSDTLSQLWELEHQKRLWARLFIMDSHMAVALGRPRGIHREDCSTSTPLDCDYPRHPSQTVPVNTDHGRQPPNAFSSVMFSIALGHKYHDLMSMRASKLDLRDYSSVLSLHNDVENMLTQLPPALRPWFPDTSWDRQKPQLPAVRLRLLTTANIFLLALHRPYILTHDASRNAAIEAALAILQAQHTLFEMVPQAQHKLYGFSFYTVDAAILLTVTVLKHLTASMHVIARALYGLEQACKRLGSMRDRSSIAATGELVIRRCYDLIAAIVPASTSVASNAYLANAPSTTNLTTISILRELGYQDPDQATRELVSLLDEPSIAQDSVPAGFTPLSDEMSFHDIGIPTIAPATGNEFLSSGPMTDNAREW